MKMHHKVLMVASCFFIGFYSYALADDPVQTGTPLQDQIQDLQALRTQNPEAYQNKMDAYKKDLREKLTRLHDENPVQFQSLMQEHRASIRQQFQDLSKDSPEKIREILENYRRTIENYAVVLKTQSPDQYQTLMVRRTQHLMMLQSRNPKAFGQFMDDHPQLKEAFQTAVSEHKQRVLKGPLNPRPGRNVALRDKWQNATPEQRQKIRKDLRDQRQGNRRATNDERFQQYLTDHPDIQGRWDHASADEKKQITERFNKCVNCDENGVPLNKGKPLRIQNRRNGGAQKPASKILPAVKQNG